MSAHGGKPAEQSRKRDDDSQETGQRPTPSPITLG
jgi:hypothetical protein